MTKHKFAFSWPLWIFFTWGLRVSILYYILTTFNTSLNKLDGKLQIQRTKELQRRTTINHVVGRSIALSLERMRFENHSNFPPVLYVQQYSSGYAVPFRWVPDLLDLLVWCLQSQIFWAPSSNIAERLCRSKFQ